MNGEVFNKCMYVCMYVNMESRKYILFRISIIISCAVTAFVKIIVFLVIIILREPLNSAINFDRTLLIEEGGSDGSRFTLEFKKDARISNILNCILRITNLKGKLRISLLVCNVLGKYRAFTKWNKNSQFTYISGGKSRLTLVFKFMNHARLRVT